MRIILTTAFLLMWCSGTQAECGGDNATILRADSRIRVFSSPNYPRAYPNNAHCTWLIVAPSDRYIVRMDTLDLSMEPSQGCTYDSITFYNGFNESAELRRLCIGFFTLYTTGRYLRVVFRSDGGDRYRGFRFQYFALLKRYQTAGSTTTIATTYSTTKSSRKVKRNNMEKGVLIGGVVGGVCLVIVLGILCGRCLGGKSPRQPPVHRPAAFYHSHAPPTPMHMGADNPTISTAVHMVQNNNAVFMVSQAMGGAVPPSQFTAGGVTNVAFDGSGDHGLSTTMGFVCGSPVGMPPPSYDDTMLTTHPPAVPPSFRQASPAGGSFSGGNGLAPPALYATRDPPGSGSDVRGDQPSVSVSGASGNHRPVRSTSLRTSSPLSTINEESFSGESQSRRRRERSLSYGFEFSTTVGSASTGIVPVVLIPTSSTQYDPRSAGSGNHLAPSMCGSERGMGHTGHATLACERAGLPRACASQDLASSQRTGEDILQNPSEGEQASSTHKNTVEVRAERVQEQQGHKAPAPVSEKLDPAGVVAGNQANTLHDTTVPQPEPGVCQEARQPEASLSVTNGKDILLVTIESDAQIASPSHVTQTPCRITDTASILSKAQPVVSEGPTDASTTVSSTCLESVNTEGVAHKAENLTEQQSESSGSLSNPLLTPMDLSTHQDITRTASGSSLPSPPSSSRCEIAATDFDSDSFPPPPSPSL